MKEEWLFHGAVVPIDVETTAALVAEIKRLIDVIGGMALVQPEQEYHRGDRLICLETEEYCVIHISGTDRQWVKFPDSHIGVYTNEQVAELFELLPKEPEQEPVAWMDKDGDVLSASIVSGKGLRNIPLYTTPPQIKGCAECGVNDNNHALYCVACAEKYLEDKNTKGQK